MDWIGMYCFLGSKNGKVTIIEVGKGERERFTKQVAEL